MNALLINVIGMPHAAMRNRITGSGFRNLDACSKFDSDYVHKACQTVRKMDGAANATEVTMEQEHRLVKLCAYAKWQYVTNGSMAPGDCDMDLCDAVHEWKEQLQEDPDDGSVQVFTEEANKQFWFEALRGYFSVKKGRSGYPVLYVIRSDAAAAVPLAWGQPSMDDHLEAQGRHDGRLYNADNAVVWLFLRQKCHGTNAWNCIRSFEPRRNGRGAYLALVGQYMGADVRALLLRRAETTLESLRFTGKSKTLTWDLFVGMFRGALHDLGDGNQLSERHKVVKFMSAFQVQELSHCDAMITHDPALSGDLNATINFLGQMLTTSKLKNGVMEDLRDAAMEDPEDGAMEDLQDEARSIAQVETDDTSDNEEVSELQALMARVKELEARLVKKLSNKQPKKSNPESPTDYKLSDDQKQATTSKVKALSSVDHSGDHDPPLKKARVDESVATTATVGIGASASKPPTKPTVLQLPSSVEITQPQVFHYFPATISLWQEELRLEGTRVAMT